MRYRPTSPLRWLRRLFRRRPDAAPEPVAAGRAEVQSGALATLSVELLASQRICLPADYPLPLMAGLEAGGRWPLNAFRQTVQSTFPSDATRAVSTGVGAALAGLRAAVYLPGHRLPESRGRLASAAVRRAPLVFHAALRAGGRRAGPLEEGHEAYHAVADTGLFMALAKNAQEAVDLTLVAHLLAEQALCPGIVAVDGPETASAVQSLRLPEADSVARLLGRPGTVIACPTEAQRVLFGTDRRRLPQWLNLELPTALGAVLSGPDSGVARVAREVFFSHPVHRLAQRAMSRVAAHTGRPLGFVRPHRVKGARLVLLAQGSAVETVEAVVDHLRRDSSLAVGSVAVTWLRPFPAEEIAAALSGAETVAVLERVDAPMGGVSPLAGEVAGALGPGGPSLVSVTYGLGELPVTAGQLAGLCHRLARGGDVPKRLYLGVSASGGASTFPKRQVLLQTVQRSAPELAQQTVEAEDLDVRPEGAYTAVLYGRLGLLPDDALGRLGTALSEVHGSEVRARSRMLAEDVWLGRVTVAETAFADAGDATGVELALLGGLDLPAWLDPLAEVGAGGRLAIASQLGGADLWSHLPERWRAHVSKHGIRVFRVLDPDDLLASLPALLSEAPSQEAEGDDGDGLEEIDWRGLGETAGPGDREPVPPAIVRRRSSVEHRYDNLPRFWGEVAQPRLLGEAPQPIPDPLLALGAVPASSAALYDRTAGRERLPRFIPDRCVACGICWSACPDAALGPLAIGTESLLDAAAARAADGDGEAQKAAQKLQRAHKQLASRVDKLLADEAAAEAEPRHFRDAFDWLVEKMGVGEDELPAMRGAFEATLEEVGRLGAAASQPLFHQPHRAKKGSGSLLLLPINPAACQGCGVCAEMCPEDALEMVTQTEAAMEPVRQGWRFWEELPDTAGAIIDAAGDLPEIGPMAAVLLSRHCQSAVTGVDGAEPGSGERLAMRLVAGTAEYRGQRALAAQGERVKGLAKRLRDAIDEQLSAALSGQDLDRLDAVLQRAPGQKAEVSALVSKLDEESGLPATVDRQLLQHRVDLARRLEEQAWSLLEGPDGLGRARFGLVVDGETAESWAARFPRNPFSAPLVVELAGDGPALAAGLADGLRDDWLTVQRLYRLGELALQDIPEARFQVEREALDELDWSDLSDAEREGCPRLFLVGRAEALTERGLGGLSRLLRADLPITLVLLDGRQRLWAPEPALLALAHRRAFVLSASIASPNHLFAGLSAALEIEGPSLVHVHAPSPRQHGFETHETVRRAAAAVEARAHPLLRYDPRESGAFGTRIRLEGNPAPASPWVKGDDGELKTPAHWALGESRFEGAFVDESELPEGATLVPIADWLQKDASARARSRPFVETEAGKRVLGSRLAEYLEDRRQNWAVLQELGGLVTPFTERVRAELKEELESRKKREVEDVASDYEQRMAAQAASQQAEQAARLRQRLLQLAGYPTTAKD